MTALGDIDLADDIEDYADDSGALIAQGSGSVTVTSTTEGSPDDVCSSGAVTYPAERIRIEAACYGVDRSNGAWGRLTLWDGNTNLGVLMHFGGPHSVMPGVGVRYLTPTAGSHTYRIRAYKSGGTVVVNTVALKVFKA